MILQKDSFKDMFIFETNDLIRQLEEIIMESESAGGFGQESVNAVFRIMHTIKGSASMMGLQSIAELAHALEDLFEYIRTEEVQTQDAQLMDIVLESLDFIRGEVDKLSERQPLDGDPAVFVSKARRLLSHFREPAAESDQTLQEKTPIVSESATQQPVKSNQEQADVDFAPETVYKATVFYEQDSGMESLRAFMLTRDMEDIADDISHLPEDISDESCEEEIRTNGFRVFFNSNRSYDELLDFFQSTVFIEKVTLIQREEESKAPATTHVPKQDAPQAAQKPEEPDSPPPIQNAPTEPSPALPLQQAEEREEKSQSFDMGKTKLARNAMISVSVEKLDTLMDLVGELVISGMMVSGELLSEINEEEIQNKRETLCYQHEKTITDLQDIAMLLRMVPVSVTFHKMRRVVRDMCRKLGVDVNIQVIGEETEIDKNVLDGISDPLLHLVRNAVDHGIGSASDRLAAGKPKQGNIVLEARNVGSDVWILVKDDGQGLDRTRIYEKAYAKGLVTKAESEMTDSEIFSYIFKPGFSTNENITEFSGRGVGLDVVNQNVSQIGGSVLVESIEGRGSTFIIKIPITLAIIGGMAFKVGDNKYSLPISTVKECLEVTEEDLILDLEGNEAVIIRGECYPILRLHKRYQIDTKITDISEGILIVIDTEYVKYCLFVDELIGEQQVVVKSLPKWIDKKIKGISGCTLLGDGSISLILEAASLIE